MNELNKNNANPDVACWRITSKCNRHCAFCYGPEVSGLEIKQIKKVIDTLAKMNIEVLGITGGEPLIKTDIRKTFEYTKSKGLKICLSTNADFFNQYQSEIFKYVDVVALPMEGSTSQLHDKIRGKGNFKAIMSALKTIYNQTSSDVLLRLATVVTLDNYKDLLNIEKIIAPYKKKIIYWRLYEFIHYEDRKKQTMQGFNPSVYQSYLAQLGRFMGRNKIYFGSSEQRGRASLLLNPNGDAVIPVEKNGETKDLVIGNVLADSQKKIISRWRQEIDLSKYRKSYHCVFRVKKFPEIYQGDYNWADYPMDSIYKKIFHLAEPLYEKSQSYSKLHIDWMIRKVLGILRQEKLNQKILIPLIILHDVGYYELTGQNPFKLSTRKKHMQAGRAIAKKILDAVNYDKDLSKKIRYYVSIHDSWAFGDNTIYQKERTLGVYYDLDFTSMLSKAHFPIAFRKIQKTPGQFIKYMENRVEDINPPFSSNLTKSIFEESLMQRKKEVFSV